MVDQKKAEQAIFMLLEAVGEDPMREGLRDTPARVARMYTEILAGMDEYPGDHLQTIFNEDHRELVLVKDIPFYSLCEHHLVPFFGKVHIAYLPQGGKITGLSKLARIVETTARRLQLQERITSTIADTLVRHLDPQAVAVMVEAEHLCMAMRGVNKPGSVTITTAVRGIYAHDEVSRSIVYSLMQK